MVPVLLLRSDPVHTKTSFCSNLFTRPLTGLPNLLFGNMALRACHMKAWYRCNKCHCRFCLIMMLYHISLVLPKCKRKGNGDTQETERRTPVKSFLWLSVISRQIDMFLRTSRNAGICFTISYLVLLRPELCWHKNIANYRVYDKPKIDKTSLTIAALLELEHWLSPFWKQNG